MNVESEKTLVGVDLDDCLWNFVEPLLDRYNQDNGKNLKKSDITKYDFSDKVNMKMKEFFKKYATEDFFQTVQPNEYAVEAINIMSKRDDCRIFFVTSGATQTIHWRDKRLGQLFDWYTSKDLIVCRNKQLLMLDYLFDDSPDNIGIRDGIAPVYKNIIFNQPWNVNIQKFYGNINSWKIIVDEFNKEEC